MIWALSTLASGYQIVRFLIDKKKDGWNSSYVVADDRILGKIKLSLAISYVFVLACLIVGLFMFEPFETIVIAIFFSLLVFMISQIVQQFIN